MKNTEPQTPFRVTTGELSPEEAASLGGGEAVANFCHYVRFSSPTTELFWAKALVGESLVGAAAVVRLKRRKATDVLRASLRRWLGPTLGPVARKTTLLLDTAFLAYEHRSPFFFAPHVDRTAIKRAISAFLKSQRKVDAVWISEPPADAAWAASEGYAQFHTLPMVHVELDGLRSMDDYAASLSKKRRRNFRHERDVFAAAGATIETHRGPVEDQPALRDELLRCLAASAAHSQFSVPYNDLLIDPRAFAQQRQTVLAARAGGQLVGFMSFLHDGDSLLQCHGGLDYQRSHDVLAYHNLIYAAIDHAITDGRQRLSMGPLNNETKRRAGGVLKPIVSSLWNRNPIDNLVARKLFIKNFEVYRGQVGAEGVLASGAPSDGLDDA